MKNNNLIKLALMLTLLINFANVVFGQNNFNNGKIVGTTFDKSEAVIAGTQIIVKNLISNNELVTESNGNGDYELNLENGQYEIAQRDHQKCNRCLRVMLQQPVANYAATIHGLHDNHLIGIVSA